MKGGLCVIYTSLLTISVLSSCVLFIIVVSEALQPEGEAPNVDLSGLHNVSQKVKSSGGQNVPNAVESDQSKPSVEEKPPQADQEMTFTETLSLNAVTADGLPDTGQPPILISLGDGAKLELQHPEQLLFSNDSEQHNDTTTFALADQDSVEEEANAEPRLVVKAIPVHETRITDEAFQTITPLVDVDPTESHDEHKEQDAKPATPQEDIPSFSEWAQKQLAEAERQDTVLNHSTHTSHSNTNVSSKSAKLRSKNYASLACGAKIVAVNPEAGAPGSILSPNRDEYMLNTCNSRIWFVVELCEAVQAQKIEIANFELFSSTPKDIAVYFSDRFPTRDWTSVGQFSAQDMRDIQSFDLFPHLFGKFIKVEMLSHHGSEHYCPISMFKVYGTSEFEVLEKESSQHSAPADDDDDDIADAAGAPAAEAEPSKNLFGSARDAVMSIMKKAAQALVKSELPKNVSAEHNDTNTKMYKRCCSPSHIIVCDNCSDSLYDEVYELISCSSERLAGLVRQAFLRDTLKCAGACSPFGLDFKSTKTIEFSNERVAYMNALFPKKYLAALCNTLAVKEKKVVLNTSFENETDVTTNMTVDETPKPSGETSSEQDARLMPESLNVSSEEKLVETAPTEPEAATEAPAVLLEPKEEVKVEDVKEEVPVDKPKAPEPDEVKPLEPEKTEPVTEQEPPKEKNGKTEVTEKAKEEEGDQLLLDSDGYMSDFEQMAVDPAPPGSAPQQSPQTTLQKESVFLRLSNRVKALERNMSLSGQYLEELSRRYKKQVEEMQRTFEKTVLQMTDERRKSNDREHKYLEQMSSLQEQLAQVAAAMRILMEERDSWFGNLTFFRFIILQTLILTAVFYYAFKNRQPEPAPMPISKRARKKQERMRRKSVEGVSGHETPSAKKRRPSEEALQIARQSAEESREDDEGEWQVARRNRRRKTSVFLRNCDKGWARQDSIGALQENPIPLDEEEFFAPVSEPAEFNGHAAPHEKELPKTNGGFFNSLKSKTMKTRRLSSPAFLRTLSRQSTRSTPSPGVRAEHLVNGAVDRKAASESPTSSLWSESTEVSAGPADEPGRKKKTLKNIFKKVF